MAYKETDYGSSFNPQIKGTGFDPVKAVNQTQQIKAQEAQKVQNIKTMAASSAAQYQIDRSAAQYQNMVENNALKMQSTYQENKGAEKIRDLQTKQAWNQAHGKAFQGLLSLTKTGMEFYGQMEKINQEEQKLNDDLAAMGLGPDGQIPEAPEVQQQNDAELQQQDIAVEAEAVALNEVATETEASGTVEDQAVGNDLRQNSTYNMLQGVRGNMTTARMMHGAYLTDAIENLPEDQRPKTAAEAMALFQQLNRDFLQQTGMSGVDRRRLARELAPTMIQNTQNAMATVVSGSIKAEREANLNQAEADIANMIPGLANGTVTPEELLRFATERFALATLVTTDAAKRPTVLPP